MEYILFYLWISVMLFSVLKVISAYVSLKRFLKMGENTYY